MKNTKYLYIFVILVSLYILTINSGFPSSFGKDIPFSKWIVGEWQGVAIYGNGYDLILAKIDFIDANHLVYYLIRDPSGENDETVFPAGYEFVSEDNIALTSRIKTEWNVYKNDGQLLVNLGQPSSFKRIPRFDRLLVFLAGVLVLRMLFRSKTKDKIMMAKEPEHQAVKLSKSSFLFLSLAVLVLCCILSIPIYLIAPVGTYFFVMGLPWGAIFIIEISSLLLIKELRILKSFYQGGMLLNTSSRSSLYLNVFLASSGACGVLIGLFIWASFAFTTIMYTGIFYLY